MTEPHPPPDQPSEPPPDEPEKPRQSRQWWIIGAAVIVVAVSLTVEVTLALIPAPTSGSSSPDSSGPDRYGQRVVDVVHELHVCDNPRVMYDGIALCEFPDGGAMVATADNKSDMDDLVASVKEEPDSGCTVVVKGYLVYAPDRDTLTHAVGNPEAFAAKHHGYLLGVCN